MQNVTDHVHPFMHRQPQNVGAANLADDAVVDWRLLWHEGAKQAIKHDQGAAVVVIDVLGVAAVVGPVTTSSTPATRCSAA